MSLARSSTTDFGEDGLSGEMLWDAVPKKVKKDYAYVPELLMLIFRFREEVDQPLRSIAGKKRVGSTITPTPPPSAVDIVRAKEVSFF